MQLKVNIGDINEALSQAVLTKDKLNHTWMGNVYIKASRKESGKGFVYIYSTNLNTETLVKIPADVAVEGEAVFDPVRMLGGLTGRPREDDIEILLGGTESDRSMTVKYKRSRFKIGLPLGVKEIAKYIQQMPLQEKGKLAVKGSDLAEFCQRGTFCIPVDDNGHSGMVLDGMYLTDDEDGYSAYVSDGIIAAQIRIKTEGNKLGKFMLPVSSLAPINRLLGRRRDEIIEIVPGSRANMLYFKAGDIIFGTRLLNGNLENLKSVVNHTKPKFQFDVTRASLKSALERASTFTPDRSSRAILMEINQEALELKMSNGFSENDDHIEIEHRGDFPATIRLAANMDYLANISGGCKSEKLSVGISSPVEAIVISEEGATVESRYVLMPVRL